MKKYLINLLILFIFMFTGTANAEVTLNVGASSSPHGEILQYARSILAKKGINLNIILFQDYILPNKALVGKEIDANYYQHIAFLERQNATFGYNLVNIGSIHIEPMGLYSKRFKKLEDVTDNTTVIMSNSVPDTGRFLSILEQTGLIKLRNFKNNIEKANATFSDIVDNPKHLQFKMNVQPSLLPSVYLNDAAGLVFINTNYAMSHNIKPKKDALFIEQGKDSLYANILVTRKDNSNDPNIKALLDVLKSKEVSNFILKKYNGEIIPVN